MATYDKPPPGEASQFLPLADGQQPAGGGYPYAVPTGAGPPPPQAYYMPPGTEAPPSAYNTPAHFAVSIDPVTGIASAYLPLSGPQLGYEQPYVTADGVVVRVIQPVYAAPPPSNQEQDPANRIETGRWSVGLCDCCNDCMPNVLMSWCCPCVALAQVYARMGLSTYQAALTRFLVLVVGGIVLWYFLPVNRRETQGYWDSNGKYVYNGSRMSTGVVITNLIYIGIQLGFTFYVLRARVYVRQRFQIPGDTCGDCLVSCCCSCCAIAQMATHVKSYKPGDCSFSGPDVLRPFN